MKKFPRTLNTRTLAALLAFTPLVTLAQEAGMTPLITVRFNKPNVYYEQPLANAVNKALAIKPDADFDVVSNAPSTGDADLDKRWQATAGHNTRAIVKAITNLGVSVDHIHVTGQFQTGLRYDETQVFVR